MVNYWPGPLWLIMTESGGGTVTSPDHLRPSSLSLSFYPQTTVEFFSFLPTDKSASHHYTAEITVSFFTFQSQDLLLESLKSNNFNDGISVNLWDDIRRPPTTIWHYLSTFCELIWMASLCSTTERGQSINFYCRYEPEPMGQFCGGGRGEGGFL